MPVLIKHATNGALQYSVLGALGSIGPGAAEAIPVIRGIINGGANPGTRMEAATALVRISPGDPEAVNLLIEELTKGTPQAAWCLASAGTAARSAVPVLLNRLDSRSLYLWSDAAGAIARIGTADDIQRAEAILLARLGSVEPMTKLNITQSLLILNPTNETAIATLVDLLSDKNWRSVAVSDLERLRDPPDAVFSALQSAGAKDRAFGPVANRALHILEYRKKHPSGRTNFNRRSK